MANTDSKLLANNKKARHEYFIEEVFEAGLALKGTEVKSARAGKLSIKESYVDIKEGQAWIRGMHISPYEQGNRYNLDPIRNRRLLLHKRQIRKLEAAIQREGYTVVPLAVYLRGRLIKIDIALAKGKKLYDKRQTLKEKDDKRRLENTFKNLRF